MPLELPLCTIIAPLLFVAFFKYAEIKSFVIGLAAFPAAEDGAIHSGCRVHTSLDQRWDGAPRSGHRTAGGFDYLLAEKAGA